MCKCIFWARFPECWFSLCSINTLTTLFWVSQNIRRWMRMTTIRLCDVREIQTIDDDEIIDRPLTLVIGFARANKRWLINEREANTCADSFRACERARKCANQYEYTSVCRSAGIVTWARNLRLGEETKFAKNRRSAGALS